MDHTYIAEQSLIERYHRGLLDPEEEARFESHLDRYERKTRS